MYIQLQYFQMLSRSNIVCWSSHWLSGQEIFELCNRISSRKRNRFSLFMWAPVVSFEQQSTVEVYKFSWHCKVFLLCHLWKKTYKTKTIITKISLLFYCTYSTVQIGISVRLCSQFCIPNSKQSYWLCMQTMFCLKARPYWNRNCIVFFFIETGGDGINSRKSRQIHEK